MQSETKAVPEGEGEPTVKALSDELRGAAGHIHSLMTRLAVANKELSRLRAAPSEGSGEPNHSAIPNSSRHCGWPDNHSQLTHCGCKLCGEIQEQRAELESKLDEARALVAVKHEVLESLRWSGLVIDRPTHYEACPVCKQRGPSFGDPYHLKDCKYAAAMRATAGAELLSKLAAQERELAELRGRLTQQEKSNVDRA